MFLTLGIYTDFFVGCLIFSYKYCVFCIYVNVSKCILEQLRI